MDVTPQIDLAILPGEMGQEGDTTTLAAVSLVVLQRQARAGRSGDELLVQPIAFDQPHRLTLLHNPADRV